MMLASVRVQEEGGGGAAQEEGAVQHSERAGQATAPVDAELSSFAWMPSADQQVR